MSESDSVWLVFVSLLTRSLTVTDQANDSEWCHANFSNYSTATLPLTGTRDYH